MFRVPRSFLGQRVILRFEGVNYNSEVWLNGQALGRSTDAFLPFSTRRFRVLRSGGHGKRLFLPETPMENIVVLYEHA